MARVFVSHSHKDKGRFVDGFVQRLRAEGLEVWYDTSEVRASHILPERVLNEGIPSCDVFVSVLSAESLRSEWVRKELNIALVRQLKGLCRIVPVVLDGVSVPPSLIDIVRVEIPDTRAFNREFDLIMAGIRDSGVSQEAGRWSSATSVDGTRRATPPWALTSPSSFVNRERELAILNRVLNDSRSSDRPRIAVLAGMPGVGKSALAAHWSTSAFDHFPDGGLYVDFAPHGRGKNHDLGDALAGLLRDLGVADEAVPAIPESQAAVFQRITADKRLLLVADNVTDAGQLKQALPSGGGSMVVATANDYLGELAVRYGAEMLELSELDRINSVEMLRELAGRDSSDVADEDWEDLSEACGGLPLALAVTGARLRRHRTWTVRDLIEDVWSADDPLVAVAGDDDRSLKRSLDASYRSFDRKLRSFYRRIGMFPGRTIEPPIAAVVAGVPQGEAVRMLGRLHDAHLVTEIGKQRYTVHQLVVKHMKSTFRREEPSQESERLATRLIEWYHGAIRCADRAVAKDRLRVAPDEQIRSAVPFPELASPSSAYKWYMLERYNIQDVMRLAYDMAHCQRLWAMAESLWLLFSARRLFADWQECLELGVAAAEVCENRDAVARLRSELARLYAERGEHDEGRAEMSAAWHQIETSDNLMLRASITEFQGTCEFLAGKNEEALAAFDSARAQMEELGSARGVAVADLQRSRVFIATGDFSAAVETARRCRAAFERLDDEVNAAKAALEVVRASVEVLPCDEAVGEARRAVNTLDRVGLAYHSAQAHEFAARVLDKHDRRAEAARHWQAAYRLYRQLGHDNADRIEAALLADID